MHTRPHLAPPLALALCLTACATTSIAPWPPVPDALMAPCPDRLADPLTSADQFDLARALTQATGSYRACQAHNNALADAVRSRQSIKP
jgi:hypothetical protein